MALCRAALLLCSTRLTNQTHMFTTSLASVSVASHKRCMAAMQLLVAGFRLSSSRGSASDISSAELIAKWQGILQVQISQTQQPSTHASQIRAEQLRQLCQDAIHVYSTEGAATVVPDRVTDIFMAAYSQLHDPQHKLQFFILLVTEFGVQRQAVDDAVQLWRQRAPPNSLPEGHISALQQPYTRSSSSNGSGSSGAGDAASSALMFRLAERLSAASQPLYMQLLLPVSQHRTGIHFLVNLRADLLALLAGQPAAELGQQGVALRALDQDLRAALARWFSLGLLQLHRITWEHSPGQLLQRVLQTEAVHKMQHMEELQRRLQQSDRRVFAFMHPSLPGEPLVVLHTAITDHIPANMDAVLTQQHSSKGSGSNNGSGRGGSSSSSEASVACFYSISSGQRGLAGVDLGNFLIKKAAQLLLAELPQLKTLVTLSPMPGFRAWLITKLRQAAAAAEAGADSNAGEVQLLSARSVLDVQSTSTQAASSSSSSCAGGDTHAAAAHVLLQLVQDNSWVSLPPQQQETLRPVFLRLCAAYLLTERRRNFALDPVAHFHLRNGAQLWRINWRADMSAQGLSNSCGLMVNYLYDLDHVAANNQRYLLEHNIAASPAVEGLISGTSQPAHVPYQV